MNYFSYAIDINIKRYQNLLSTSTDETERRTIQTLLAEEKAKEVALQASEPRELNDAAADLSRPGALQDTGGGHHG